MSTFFLKKLNFFLIIGDYFAINFFYYFWIKHYFGDHGIEPLTGTHFISSLLMMNLRWLFIAGFTNVYKRFFLIDLAVLFSNLTKAFFFFIIMCFLFFDSVTLNVFSDSKARDFFISFSFSLLLFMIVLRLILLLIRKNIRTKENEDINTILIGENNFTQALISNYEIRENMGIKGIYAVPKNDLFSDNIKNFIRNIENREIDNIVISDDSIRNDEYQKIVAIAEKRVIRTYVIPSLQHFISFNDNSVKLDQGIPIIKVMPEPLDNFENQLVKRAFDIVFSLFFVIFILSWLTPIIALLIKLESKGPVFFAQRRSGLKNKDFMCLKFRSMRVNDIADKQVAKKNDKRITRIGAFLRKTSLDEFPQFFNVLKGEMSVVGPRPHMISQTQRYSRFTDKYMVRHFIKPGITGWAQVTGARGEIRSNEDMERRVEKDIWYIQNWSLFLDLKIIFLTAYNIIKGDKQAY